MGTALHRAQAQTDLCLKARAQGVPAEAVDGMDVLAVARATDDAVAAIRGGGGPRFLEYRTYRFRAHSMYDPELYRTKAEVEQWRKRDPIPAYSDSLKRDGLLTDADVQRIEAGIAAELDDAIRFAEESPWEPAENLLTDVYSPRPA
jgi:TPP-dependent pyruvate/acetoin dehydrogenase alpha subunit